MAMLKVNDEISIPLRELRWEYTRSSGPGGQNVNKVHSRAVLRWNPAQSSRLPEQVCARLVSSLSSRLTREGDLILASQRTRDRGRNAEDCLKRLRTLILAAAKAPKRRRPSRPTLASKERRVEAKLQRSATKKLRQKPESD
jgi:ribosome-associated protein